MIDILDFNEFSPNARFYDGSSSRKYGITIDGEDFFLKFPTQGKIYTPFSEYIGSHFYEYMGIPAQETWLGIAEKYLVVACKDFCEDDYSFYDFSKIANAYMGPYDSPCYSNKFSREEEVILNNVLAVIDGVPQLESIREDLKARFWDMFIVDSLLANADRKSGDWGILVPFQSKRTASMEVAPVFANGKSLNIGFSDEALEEYRFKKELKRIDFCLQTPSIFEEINKKGETQKINPYKYCRSHKNSDCDAALLRLGKRIPEAIKQISVLIDDISLLDDNRKEFFKESIRFRYKYGLLKAIRDLSEHEED